jgi:hypothetical protein
LSLTVSAKTKVKVFLPKPLSKKNRDKIRSKKSRQCRSIQKMATKSAQKNRDKAAQNNRDNAAQYKNSRQNPQKNRDKIRGKTRVAVAAVDWRKNICPFSAKKRCYEHNFLQFCQLSGSMLWLHFSSDFCQISS